MTKWTANYPRSVIEIRERLARYGLSEIPEGILISITDPDSPEITLSDDSKRIFTDVYRFRFFDREEETSEGSLTEEQAREMAAVIRANYDRNIYTHCHQGMCRSGAVSHVLQELGWSLLRNSNPQMPNLLVKSRLRREFGLTYFV